MTSLYRTLTEERCHDVGEARDEIDVDRLDLGGIWQPCHGAAEEVGDGQRAGDAHAHLGGTVAFAQPETGEGQQDKQRAGAENLKFT